MRILLTVIFGSAFLFSCTQNPPASSESETGGLKACAKFEKEFTFGHAEDKICARGNTENDIVGFYKLTENVNCEPRYTGCVFANFVEEPDRKSVYFFYAEDSYKPELQELCNAEPQNINGKTLTMNCKWYQD